MDILIVITFLALSLYTFRSISVTLMLVAVMLMGFMAGIYGTIYLNGQAVLQYLGK